MMTWQGVLQGRLRELRLVEMLHQVCHEPRLAALRTPAATLLRTGAFATRAELVGLLPDPPADIPAPHVNGAAPPGRSETPTLAGGAAIGGGAAHDAAEAMGNAVNDGLGGACSPVGSAVIGTDRGRGGDQLTQVPSLQTIDGFDRMDCADHQDGGGSAHNGREFQPPGPTSAAAAAPFEGFGLRESDAGAPASAGQAVSDADAARPDGAPPHSRGASPPRRSGSGAAARRNAERDDAGARANGVAQAARAWGGNAADADESGLALEQFLPTLGPDSAMDGVAEPDAGAQLTRGEGHMNGAANEPHAAASPDMRE